jgi:septum formation protein
VAFEVRPSSFEESEQGEAHEVALANALGKALDVPRAADELVLGVDTVVSLDGRLFAKPASAEQARATLRALSGRTHIVVSGVALAGEGAPRTATADTAVSFRDLSASEIEWYLGRGEWRERAGGYAIQGSGCALVAAIEGDWTNVVGLPVATLLGLLPTLLAQHCVQGDG